MDMPQFTRSSVGEHLGCAYLVTGVTNDAMDMCAQTPVVSLLSGLCISWRLDFL